MNYQTWLSKGKDLEKKLERDVKNLKIVFWVLVAVSVFFVTMSIVYKSGGLLIILLIFWLIYLILFGLNKFMIKSLKKLSEEKNKNTFI